MMLLDVGAHRSHGLSHRCIHCFGDVVPLQVSLLTVGMVTIHSLAGHSLRNVEADVLDEEYSFKVERVDCHGER